MKKYQKLYTGNDLSGFKLTGYTDKELDEILDELDYDNLKSKTMRIRLLHASIRQEKMIIEKKQAKNSLYAQQETDSFSPYYNKNKNTSDNDGLDTNEVL